MIEDVGQNQLVVAVVFEPQHHPLAVHGLVQAVVLMLLPPAGFVFVATEGVAKKAGALVHERLPFQAVQRADAEGVAEGVKVAVQTGGGQGVAQIRPAADVHRVQVVVQCPVGPLGGGVQGGHVPLEMIPALEPHFPRHGVQGIAQPGLFAHRGEAVYGDASQAATVAGQGRVQ